MIIDKLVRLSTASYQRFLAFLKIWALDLSKVFIVLEECKYIPEHKLSVGRGCLYYNKILFLKFIIHS